MMTRTLTSLFLMLTVINCSGGGLGSEQCATANVAPGTLTQTVHPQVKNSPQHQDFDPSNDYDALDASLSRIPGEYTTVVKVGGTPIQVVADSGSSRLLVGTNDFKPTGAPLGGSQLDRYGSCQAVATDYTAQVGLFCGNPVTHTIASTSSAHCPNILGLAYGSGSGIANAKTFMGDLAKAGFADVFSMSLCGRKTGSQIVLGGMLPDMPTAISYTPVVQKEWYVVVATSMSNVSESLGTFLPSPNLTGGGTVIVDTGTTLTIVPPSMHTAIVAAMQAARPDLPASFFTATQPSDANYVMTPGELGDISKLPTLTLTFAGETAGSTFSITVPPSVYIKDLDGNNFIFGFRPMTANDSFPMLGQSVLDQRALVFDRGNAKVGFASSAGICK